MDDALKVQVAQEIRKKFSVSEAKALDLAAQLIVQAVAHGGDLHDPEQRERTIAVIIDAWLGNGSGKT